MSPGPVRLLLNRVMKLQLRRDVIVLTTPVFFEQLFVNLLGIVNTIMAARVSREAVSAIGMVDAINQIILALFSALAIGATVVVAQCYGRGEHLRAGKAMLQATVSCTLLAVSLGALAILMRKPLLAMLYGNPGALVETYMQDYLLITALSYPLTALTLVISGALRGAGETRMAMQANTLMNVANVILGYVLIYGMHLRTQWLDIHVAPHGVIGAACAISLARLAGALYLLYALRRHRHLLPARLRGFRFDTTLLRPIFAIGIPSGIESLVFNGGKLLVQIMVVGMGTAAVAASFIGFSISTLLNIPGNALAVALTTLVGQSIGRRDERRAENDMWYVLCLATALMTSIGMVCWPLARWFVGLYSQDAEIIALGSHLVQLNCLFLVVWPATFVLPNGLKGAGDARYAMVTTLIGMCAFRILLGYVFGVMFEWGVTGVWLGMFADWLIRSTLYLARFSRGHWKGRQLIA